MTEEKKANETINIPFISYVEGSYFGDSDIFLPDTTRFERDSTAICARQESQFFVLAREVIVQLKVSFTREVQEMEQLSLRRRKKHNTLIKDVARRALKVQKDNAGSPHVDYEFEMLMLDEFRQQPQSELDK